MHFKGLKNTHSEWSVDKSLVLCAPDLPGPALTLAGEPLREDREGRYLGVPIDPSGLTPSLFKSRLNAAKARLAQLQYLGLRQKGICIGLGTRLYKIFVRSLMEFAIHLTPLDNKAL